MLAGALALQLAFGLVFAWGVVVPLVRAQEHWPPVLLGAVFSGTPAGYGLGTVAGGRLADRLPPRLLCWAALGLLALGFGVAFAAPSGATFVIAYAFIALGLGGGVALTGAVAALVAVFPNRAGSAGGGASAAYAGSAIFQAPLIGALAPRLGWLGALGAVGLGMALLAAAMLALMPALPRRHKPATQSGVLLLSPAVWTGFCLAFCGSTFGAYAAVEVAAEALARHAGAAVATAAVAAFAAGNAGGRLLAGLAADHAGVGPVILAALLLSLAACVVLLTGVGPVTAVLAALVAGGSLGGDTGSLARSGAEAAPGQPNAAFGLLFAGYALGVVCGTIAGTLVGPPAAWLVTVAPVLAGLALLATRSRLLAQPARR